MKAGHVFPFMLFYTEVVSTGSARKLGQTPMSSAITQYDEWICNRILSMGIVSLFFLPSMFIWTSKFIGF